MSTGNTHNVLFEVQKRIAAGAKKQSDTVSPKALTERNCPNLSLVSTLEEKSRKLLALTEKDFVHALNDLSGFLDTIDPAPSELFQAIDRKGQDFATYYFAAYSGTGDVKISYRIYRTIKSLVRYVVLMDRYYEIGTHKYKHMASTLITSVKADNKGYLKYALPFSFAQCRPFFRCEKMMKEKMLAGDSFSYKEIRYHNMFKSSDAPTIYGRVLDSELEDYNSNVSLVLHYNQALQDIQDDLEDLREDLEERLPNIFILGAVESTPFSMLAANPDSVLQAIARSKSLDKILNLVKDYENSVEGIILPSQYRFLKYLTRDYAKRLYESIRVLREKTIVVKVANPTVH